MVADRPGEAGAPGPVVISESSQYADESLSVNDVEPKRSHSARVKAMLGRTWQYVTQPIEHWAQVTHQM